MPIEQFTILDFTKALPVIAIPLGLQEGEYCFLVPILPNNGVGIFVRSSIRPGGTAAECGKDSIRCWLVDRVTQKPLAAKLSKYITRVPGWKDRMLATLRTLYRIGKLLGPCPKCGKPTYMSRVKDKTKPSYNRPFISCQCKNHFAWVPDAVAQEIR